MRNGFLVLLLAVLFGMVLWADEHITIPMPDGTTSLVVNVKRIQTFEEYNHPSMWRIAYDVRRFGRLADLDNPLDIKLQFDVGGLCAKKPDQWSSVSERRHVTESPTHGEFDLEDSVGCTIEMINVALISAVRGDETVAHNNVQPVDFTEQLNALQAQRDLEAARQRRLAAERKRKQAEDAASYAKYITEKNAKEAEERAKVRSACATIYKSTADKKVGDLLVKEEQQVRACQALGLYPPR